MYLWNINELAQQLKKNTLQKREVFGFYLLSPLLSICNIVFFSFLLASHHFTASMFAHFLTGRDQHMPFYNMLGLIAGSMTIVISCIGLYLCYRTNKKGDGKQFFKRMACLSFPVNFHLTVYLLALFSLIAFFSYLILHGKIIFFKKYILSLTKSNSTIGQALREGLRKIPIEGLAPKVQKVGSLSKVILGAPITVLKLPFVPGQINKFLTTLRRTVLAAYPIIVFIPPFLSFLHYLIIRKILKTIC